MDIKNMSAWKELESLFILLENDEELDNELKEKSNSCAYFLSVLEWLSPFHKAGTKEDKNTFYIEQLSKLYALCFLDEGIDREIGSCAGIESGYLSIPLECVIPAYYRSNAIKELNK